MIEVVKMLVEKGINIESKDENGETPLILGKFENRMIYLVCIEFKFCVI